MKKLAFLIPLVFLLSCTSNSDKKNGADGNTSDLLTGFDLNTMITKTIFDSVPFEKFPYTDSICIANSMSLREIPLSSKNLEFLKLKKLGELEQYYEQSPDSMFSLVCRLALSGNFYSVIFNYNSANESMNYLINYDRDFRVIDYIETCYNEGMDCSMRISSVIDTSGLAVTHNNILDPESKKVYYYSITPDGFFREWPDKQVVEL